MVRRTCTVGQCMYYSKHFAIITSLAGAALFLLNIVTIATASLPEVMTARFAGFWSGLVYIGAGMAGITAGNLQRRGAANRKMSLVASFFTCLSALLVSVGFAAFLSIEGLATGETPYVQRLEYAFYALAFIGAYFSVAVAIGTGISLCFYETSLDIYRRNQAESIHVSWQRSAGPGQPQPSGLVTVSGFLQPQPKLHDPPPAYKEATGGFV